VIPAGKSLNDDGTPGYGIFGLGSIIWEVLLHPATIVRTAEVTLHSLQYFYIDDELVKQPVHSEPTTLQGSEPESDEELNPSEAKVPLIRTL
jgi:hypothetical protein